MCEVLEHVEHPLLLLDSLRKCLADGGHAFVSVPVNAPEKDHIFLFRSLEEVEHVIIQAGFKILSQRVLYTKNRTLKRSIKKGDAILTAFVLV